MAAHACCAQHFTYCNPNKQVPMRDTQIIPNPDDGKFYAIGTLQWGGVDSLKNAGFRLYVSDDMINWKEDKWIMRCVDIPKDSWIGNERYWAPEIHKINGLWYLTYNCASKLPADSKWYWCAHGSGIAVADKIEGPYRNLSQKPLTPYPSNDLTLFQDENQHVYALFNTGFFAGHPEPKLSIYIAQIDLQTGALIEEPRKLLTQQGGFEAEGIEGSYLVKDKGIYYLFYSGWEGGYAVGYATSKNIYGPYLRAQNSPLFGACHSGELIRNGKRVANISHPYREIGHNQIFYGPDGHYWTSCHAYLKGGDNRYGSYLVIDPIRFKDGRVETKAPTWRNQTVNVTNKMRRTFPGLNNPDHK